MLRRFQSLTYQIDAVVETVEHQVSEQILRSIFEQAHLPAHEKRHIVSHQRLVFVIGQQHPVPALRHRQKPPGTAKLERIWFLGISPRGVAPALYAHLIGQAFCSRGCRHFKKGMVCIRTFYLLTIRRVYRDDRQTRLGHLPGCEDIVFLTSGKETGRQQKETEDTWKETVHHGQNFIL